MAATRQRDPSAAPAPVPCLACDEGAPLAGGRRHACLLRPAVLGSNSEAERLDAARRRWLDEAAILAAKLQDLADRTPYGFARYGGNLKAATVGDALETIDRLRADEWAPKLERA